MSETTELAVPTTLHIETGPEPVPEPTEAATERPKSAREIAMEAIALRREEAINRELAEYRVMAGEATDRATGQEIGTTEAATEHQPTEPAPQATHQPEPSPTHQPAAQEPTQQQPTERRRIVQVGGAQYSVTDAEYDHLAQIGAMAQAELQRQQQPATPPQQVQPTPAPRTAAPLIDDETARTTYRRIAFGTEDEGAQALRDLAGSVAAHLQQNQIDPGQIQQQAVAQALQTIELNTNLATIGNEYPEIFNDRVRSQLAALQLHELRQRNAAIGRQQDNLSLYREACTNVRSAISPPSQQPQPAQQTPPAPQAAITTERLDRKRAAPRQPSSAAARAPSEQQAPREPNKAEVVEWMRRSRGQVPMR